MKKQVVAIAEAIVGVPIVVSQRLAQRISDSQIFDSRRAQQKLAGARLVGMMTVRFGSREIVKKIRKVWAIFSDSPAPTTIKPLLVSDTAIEDDLAIAHYATLSAVDIIAKLEPLSRDDLRAVSKFETAHRARRTILAKIDQLLPL